LSRLVVNVDGGTSNSYGFQVVPNGTPNMTVLVNPGSGRIFSGTYPSSFHYLISHDTVGGESVTIATAAASPRIDYIVGYIDKGVTPSLLSANVNNTNGILKFASVAGTPAGSPVVPTVSQIQTAIGAANPYIILAQVAVGASVSTITAPNISDIRNMAYTTAKVSASTIDFSSLIVAQQAWQIPTLLNGWTNYGSGYEDVKYMKDLLGFVHLKGFVKSGSGQIILLPVGYRPAAHTYIATVSSPAVFAGIEIRSTGEVNQVAGNNTYMSLGHSVFRAEN
jgi:hypothetical protein